MDVLQPTDLAEALELKAAHPGAVPLAGGTDVMVELNFDRRRPGAIIDLTRVPELDGWSSDEGRVRLGAGVTFTRVIDELGELLPGLALASRTVGSPQIRNRGTIGGNLGTSSPAGDALPPLMAAGAEVELASTRGTRRLTLDEFLVGPKRNVAEPDELIVAVHVPEATGAQQFSKIGTRNAMVIAVAAFAVCIDEAARAVRTGIGSAGPTILRAAEAESFITSALEEGGLWESRAPLLAPTLERFGQLVARAARPIDDVRGTADYRRHALGVMARRTLMWAWNDHARSA
ncbi:MAG: xanthine dehydrogenase family protein subunit M [Actinomycetota bacterium]